MLRSLFFLTTISSTLLSLSVSAETLNGPVNIQGWDIYYTQGKSWLDIVNKFSDTGPLVPGAEGVNTNSGNGYLTGLPEGAKFYFPWATDQNLASVYAHYWYDYGSTNSYPNDAVRLPNDQPPFSTIKHTPFFVWDVDISTSPVYWEAYTDQNDSAAGSTLITDTAYNFAVAVSN